MHDGRNLTETIISYIVVFLLIFIGGTIFRYQLNYDISNLGFVSAEMTDTTQTETFDIKKFVPSELDEFGRLESYGTDNLYEKINGKAPLYLDSDFVKLYFQTFVLDTDTEGFIQIYIYDMAQPINAFSVYSSQKRRSVKNVEGLSQGYKTGNSLFFTAGKFYIEMIGSKVDDTINAKMLEMAVNINSSFADIEKNLSPADMFPAENMIEDSIALYKNDAFGYSGLKNVYVCNYEIDNEQISAFIIEAKNSGDAKKAFGDYLRHLSINGFVNIENGVLEYDGIFEMVFIQGKYVYGVHEAFNVNIAKQVASKLRLKIERH